MRAPAALVLDEDAVELEPLDDPVPVGAVVTVPVPAVPAWLKRLEHVLLVDPVWTLALPLKSHAVETFLLLI